MPEPGKTRPSSWHAVGAGFLGWTLDAFDFFVVIFLFDTLAAHFNVPKSDIVLSVTATLAMRPVGALIFGMLADRYGRRRPLMANVLFFSTVELLCGFAPNYTVFFILRMLFGIGMGGEWGLGASLVMETLPTAARGLFSGILQQGYAFGYLLAAVVYWIVFPFFGWRGLFVAGALPAVLVLYIRARVPESPVWLRQRHAIGDFWRQALFVLKRHWALFLYVILLMTAFNAISHGTQDMYQTFLGEQRHYGVTQKATTGIIYAVGAICGGTVVGHLSQKWGRRRCIVLCSALGIVLIPLWAFSPGYTLLVIGGFAMQFMVQGAWGIVPVHLNELSPDTVRGTFPGFAYQLGNLFAANTAVVEAQLAHHFHDASGHPDYAKALGLFTLVTFAILIFLAVIGPEKRGREF